MNLLESRTVNEKSGQATYKTKLSSAILFLNHPEDKFSVIKGKESLNISVYENGELIFSGDKNELFKKLKS
jgi:hypothetical protein